MVYTRDLKYDVSLISTIDENFRNYVPWERLTLDVTRYLRVTTGVDVVCGRGTFQAMSPRAQKSHIERAARFVIPSDRGAEWIPIRRGATTVCIGGVYTQGLIMSMIDPSNGESVCRKAYITSVNGRQSGTQRFPRMGPEWSMVSCSDWITQYTGWCDEDKETYRLEYWVR